MKKEILFGLTLALFLGFVFVSADSITGSSGLAVVLTNQMPYPVEPGNNFDIQIEIQNNGYADANERIIEIIDDEPFKLLPGENRTKFFNKIGAKESVKTSYKLFVNESVLTGDYNLKFRIYPSGQEDVYIEDSVSIRVNGIPDLVVMSIHTEPQDMAPGSMVNVGINFENVGTGTARNVKAMINSSSSYIMPVLSGGLVYIGDVEPGVTAHTELNMSIDSNAEYQTYSATLTLSYKDENNTAMERIVDIGIPVTGTINLEIIDIETDFDSNKLKIKVANKGSTDAKSVEATLVISGSVVGIDYISQLKASKYTTFDFPLLTQGSGYLKMDYIGPTLKNEQSQEEVFLNYPDPRITNMITSLITLIVVLIIIRHLWKRYKKGKKPKHA